MGFLKDLLDKIFAKKEEAKPQVENLDSHMTVADVRKELDLPPLPKLSDIKVVEDVTPVIKIDNTWVYVKNGVVFWKSGMQIDADGCPRAYHPKNIGLDYLANAGTAAKYDDAGVLLKEANWYGIITDNGKPNGKPVEQKVTDVAPGYYISPTALTDKTKKVTDPTCYVDSQYIPYIAVPPQLKLQGVKLGDLCMVSYKDKMCAAIVADIGPRAKIGEGSMALAVALGINASPKHGGTDAGVVFYIFPGTSKGWPRTLADIKQAEQLFVDKNVKI